MNPMSVIWRIGLRREICTTDNYPLEPWLAARIISISIDFWWHRRSMLEIQLPPSVNDVSQGTNACSFWVAPQRHTTFHTCATDLKSVLNTYLRSGLGTKCFAGTPSHPDVFRYVTLGNIIWVYLATRILERFYVLNLLPRYYKAGLIVRIHFHQLGLCDINYELPERSLRLLCISAFC